jgi:hypothetical protein
MAGLSVEVMRFVCTSENDVRDVDGFSSARWELVDPAARSANIRLLLPKPVAQNERTHQ